VRGREPKDGEGESQELGPPAEPGRARRLDWSALLARVFEEDVLSCRCGGRRRVTAFVPEGRRAREVLEALGIEATAPPIAPARRRAEQQWLDLPDAIPDYAA